jgi:hypothetical protein
MGEGQDMKLVAVQYGGWTEKRKWKMRALYILLPDDSVKLLALVLRRLIWRGQG